MKWHRVAIVLGLIGIVIGILEASNPGILTTPRDRRSQFLIGGALMIYAYFVVESVRENPLSLASTTDPELRVPAPVLGERLDQVVNHFLDPGQLYRGPRVKEGIRAAAIEAIVRYRGRSRDDARELVDSGAWTTDRTAAGFLADSARNPASPVGWIASRIRPESMYHRAVSRTVQEICEIAEMPEDTAAATLSSQARRWLADRAPQTPLRTATTTTPDRTGERDHRMTNHWTGISVVAVVCFAIGLLGNNAGVFLAGLVGVGYLAFSRSPAFATVKVSCERSVSSTAPRPGEEISVTLTIENTGTNYLPDVRVVDGVPEALGVTNGSPRIASPLRPGQTVSITYSILARRGRHEFGPVHVITKSLTAAVEHELSIATKTQISCIPRPRTARVPIPLRASLTHTSGRVAIESGGSGVEFHSSREYREGDELTNVDWRRFARTGTVTALEYRQERTATIVLAIDTDRSAYVAPTAFADHAVDRAIDAAIRMFNRLVADNHFVGIASFGSDAAWVAPRNTPVHRDDIHRILGIDDAFATHPPADDPGQWSIDRFRQRVPRNGQVIVVSPVCARATTRDIQRLEASGVPVSVVSPDPTTGGSPSRALARMFREFQLTDLRSMGIPVVNWSATEHVEHALARAAAREHS